MAAETTYRNRRAFQVENAAVRISVLVEGGHIAEVLHKPSGLNPLWTPPWPSIEPSTYSRAKHPGYGGDAESKLLAGIMGHNLCLDIFGGPSESEAAAGLTVHGEASIVRYDIAAEGARLTARAALPMAQIDFERELVLHDERVEVRERATSRLAFDRPIAWTQHVTLGPPFLERGRTEFRISATRGRTYDEPFGDDYPPGVEFAWPNAPLRSGDTRDLRRMTDAGKSAGYTALLLDPDREDAFFTAWSPAYKVWFGYRWKRADFPWLGMWEENHFRGTPPWNGKTLTRGLEFGVSPMPETRRRMVERGSLFGVPSYCWLPARGTLEARYQIAIGASVSMPDGV